ncbi:hypothetical protein AMTR_s00017p00157150 [Amborella trichopoda]|uniref:Uncharacterized protein n=1 Tax=Amborella trichopoda TaxID=13333 RepID=W1PN39_AMBTC|nr:hypothetical protein AMTR_s00017p00157150 [Amborella trichopoda]
MEIDHPKSSREVKIRSLSSKFATVSATRPEPPDIVSLFDLQNNIAPTIQCLVKGSGCFGSLSHWMQNLWDKNSSSKLRTIWNSSFRKVDLALTLPDETQDHNYWSIYLRCHSCSRLLQARMVAATGEGGGVKDRD